MKVEIWSDVVCPFCYIGKRKFEMALDKFGAKDIVEVEWRSFQLDPEMQTQPGQTVHDYLATRKGVSPADAKRMNDSMTAMAAQVGLEYNFDKAIINNTLDAHRLLHFAKTKGVQREMKERLFRAYYTEGKDVADAATLASLGEELGLDPSEIKNMLQSDDYKSAVSEDQYEAQQVGARGVPFYVFNNRYAVSGAQSPEVFAEVLEKVWEEEKPAATVVDGEGFCTPDGECK